MKGAQLAINVLLFVLMIVLFYLHFNETEPVLDSSQQDQEVIQNEETEQLEIRFINTDSIWSNYAYVEQLRTDLNKKQKQYEAELERKVQDFQSEIQDFQKEMMSLSREEGQKKQQELMIKEQELQLLQEDYNLKLLEEEEKMKEELREKIAQHLQEYKDQGVDLILDNSANSSTLLYSDSLDVTRQVLKSMNENIKEEKARE